MKILVVGAQGQLARAVMQQVPPGAECVGLTRADLDIRDPMAVETALRAHAPDWVVNGAAYNLVDKAETESQNAFDINAVGVANLARAARETGAALLHFSTDFVFDGTQRTPYEETDLARPMGVYGASKLAGEGVCLAASPRNLVVRVSRLFGPTGDDGPDSSKKPAGNFPLLMLKLGRERPFVRVVNDQIGTPSYTPDVARGAWQLLQGGQGGLFHLSNAGEVAFDEYTREIFRLANVNCRVESVSSQDYGAPAARPLYSTLSNARAHAHGVAPLRDWRAALEEFVGGL